MTKMISIFILSSCLLSVAPAAVVIAFGVDPHPFYHLGETDIKVCYLNRFQKVLDTLNDNLKGIRSTAVFDKTHFIQDHHIQIEHLNRESKCLVLLTQFQIKKVPAIVFNHKEVIYGLNDIERAREIYDDYQEEQDAK